MTHPSRALVALAAAAVALPLGPLAAPAHAGHVDVQPLTTACPADAVSENPYADVDEDNTFALAIACLSDHGLAQGRTATTFEPAAEVLRRQMALFVYRLGLHAGASFDTTTDPGFSDDQDLSGETRDAVWGLANAGIVLGAPDGSYSPNGAVTRDQMASFLARLADTLGLEGRFAGGADFFDDDEGNVHEGNIDAIASEGITVGRGGDRLYAPRERVTRQQMAGFLARTLNVVVEEQRGIVISATGAATLVVHPNPDSDASDDRTYTVRGLEDGVDYRIALYDAEFVSFGDHGDTAFVVDETSPQEPSGAYLAATGSPSAAITMVNGAATNPDFDGAEGEVARAVDGAIHVVVDGDAPTTLVPVVHRNGGEGRSLAEGGSSPRLEVTEQGHPLEPVAVGGTTTYTAP